MTDPCGVLKLTFNHDSSNSHEKNGRLMHKALGHNHYRFLPKKPNFAGKIKSQWVTFHTNLNIRKQNRSINGLNVDGGKHSLSTITGVNPSSRGTSFLGYLCLVFLLCIQSWISVVFTICCLHAKGSFGYNSH